MGTLGKGFWSIQQDRDFIEYNQSKAWFESVSQTNMDGPEFWLSYAYQLCKTLVVFDGFC